VHFSAALLDFFVFKAFWCQTTVRCFCFGGKYERGGCKLSNMPKDNKIKRRLGVFWCILVLHCSIFSCLKHFGVKPLSSAPVLEANYERGDCELSNEPKKSKIKNRLGVFWCILVLHCSIFSSTKHFGVKKLSGAPFNLLTGTSRAVKHSSSPEDP